MLRIWCWSWRTRSFRRMRFGVRRAVQRNRSGRNSRRRCWSSRSKSWRIWSTIWRPRWIACKRVTKLFSCRKRNLSWSRIFCWRRTKAWIYWWMHWKKNTVLSWSRTRRKLVSRKRRFPVYNRSWKTRMLRISFPSASMTHSRWRLKRRKNKGSRNSSLNKLSLLLNEQGKCSEIRFSHFNERENK